MTPSQPTSICIGCGLCCDGTLYSTVSLESGDQPVALARAGIPIVKKEERDVFRQPCMAFQSGCCTVYDDRPAVCSRYRCHLLKRYESGEIGEAEARAVIAETLAIRDQVRAGLFELLGSSEWRPIDKMFRRMIARFESESDPAEAKRKHSEVLLSSAGLRARLRKEFLGHEAEYDTSQVPVVEAGSQYD